MGQLMCPLCGKFNSLRFFNPNRFELDILGVDTRGLGRGKGARAPESGINRFGDLRSGY
jgi:hypothetical protein